MFRRASRLEAAAAILEREADELSALLALVKGDEPPAALSARVSAFEARCRRILAESVRLHAHAARWRSPSRVRRASASPVRRIRVRRSRRVARCVSRDGPEPPPRVEGPPVASPLLAGWGAGSRDEGRGAAAVCFAWLARRGRS